MARRKVEKPVEIVESPGYTDSITGIHVNRSLVDRRDHYHQLIHFHYFYEMELVISGKGWYEINNTSFPLQKGALFLVTPADFHQYSLKGNATMDYYNLQFPGDMLSEDVGSALYSFSEPIHIQLNDEEYEFFERRLAYILHIYREKPFLYEKMLKNEIESLCIRLIQMSSGRVQGHVRDEIIKKAIIYIKNNYRRPITLEEISTHVGLSPCYFSSYFSNVMKVSFSAYVKRFRLNVAANLIKSTNMTLNEISYEVGFKTFSYFSEQFRRQFHMSPKEYKSQYRKQQS